MAESGSYSASDRNAKRLPLHFSLKNQPRVASREDCWRQIRIGVRSKIGASVPEAINPLERSTGESAVPQPLEIPQPLMQQVALILLLMTSWNFTDEELALLRSMPKHEIEPHEPWLAKPPIRPRHVQRSMVFRGEWTPESGDAEFSVYIRQGLLAEGDFSCGIAYRVTSGESLMLARYCGWRHSHREIIRSPHIHWLTGRALAAGTPVDLEAMVTDRFDNLESAVLCLVEDFNLSEIHFPYRLRRLFDGSRH